MAQQSFAGLAVLIALTFAIMALQGCAVPEQRVAQRLAMVAPLKAVALEPVFHGAPIGADSLRSRLAFDA